MDSQQDECADMIGSFQSRSGSLSMQWEPEHADGTSACNGRRSAPHIAPEGVGRERPVSFASYISS
eukprot:6189042-Pleurochrysis_carterae.AAC.4